MSNNIDIKPQYKHSKVGNLCFYISTKCTKLLSKQR